MHSEVLSILDAHLAELQALRRDLVAARPIGPGGRRRITADAAASALRCARRLGILLAGQPVGRISGPGFLMRQARLRHRSSRWLVPAVPPAITSRADKVDRHTGSRARRPFDDRPPPGD